MTLSPEIQRDVDYVLNKAMLDYNKGDEDDLTLLEILNTYERLSVQPHSTYFQEQNKSSVYLALLNFKKKQEQL